MRKLLTIAATAGMAFAPLTAASAGTWTDAGVEGAQLASDNECGFTTRQISDGFKCYVVTSTETVHRTIAVGGNPKCQEGTRTSTTFYAVNKNDNIMTTRTASVNDEFGEDGEIEWSGPPAAGACPA